MLLTDLPIAGRRGGHARRQARPADRRPRRDARRLLHDARRSPADHAADYRQRHPIAIKEGERSLEVLRRQRPRRPDADAARRGPRLRADLEARGDRRHHHRSAGRQARTSAPRSIRCRQVLSILVAAGIPEPRHRHQAVSRRRPSAGDAADQLSADGRGSRAMRAVAGRPRSDLRSQALREPAVLQSRLRHAAQPRRHGRQSGRSGAAARRNARPTPPSAPSARQIAQGREPGDDLSRHQQGQDQRSRQMIRNALQTVEPEARRPNRPRATSTSRRRRASRSRRSARRSKPPPRSRPPARTAGWARRISRSRWAASPRRSKPIAASPTPNVIMLESEGRGDGILDGLDALAEFCDAGTRVIVIGRHNDVMLYRELMRRGVSDYLIAPVGTLDVVRSICGLFSAPDAKPVGRIIAVVGAKGGVGASTIAHNIAWAIGARPVARFRGHRPRSRLRHRRPRLQPGSAAGHRRRGVLARPHRHRLRRPPAVESAPTI